MYWDGNATADAGENAYWNAATASYCYNGTTAVNHGVEIVVWDDDYPKENFTTGSKVTSDGVWLVRNSWNSAWGDYGYFWISYEDSKFPIEAFCINGVEQYDNSLTVYETDYIVSNSYIGNSSITSAFYARVFKANAPEEVLKSVRVLVDQPSTVEVDCVSASALIDNYQFTPREKIEAEYSGWYTIDLSQNLSVNGDFAVVVKFSISTSGEIYMNQDKKTLFHLVRGTMAGNMTA